MYSLIFIAVNNIKKKKGDAIILFFLAMLSIILLYVSISALNNTEAVQDKTYQENNTPDFLYMAPSSVKPEKISRIFQEQDEVNELEKSEALYVMSSKYRNASEKKKKDVAFILESIETERNIGRLPDNLEEEKQESSILLPYYMKASGGYEVGDKIFLTLEEQEYEFVVLGFVEDPLFATPLNINVYRCYITSDYMKKILKAEPSLNNCKSIIYKIKLQDGESSYDFEGQMLELFGKEVPELQQTMNLGLNWESMKDGGVMLCQITMGIVLVFSVLLILISAIVVWFSVRSFIEDNLKNIGILQAGGYTSRQLRLASMLEIMGITFAGSMMGLMIGAIGSEPIGRIQASMMGLSWNQKFDMASAGIALGVILLLCFLVTYSVSRMYKKIPVLDALRGGIHAHNFRKNNFPLEHSVFPVSLVLGQKNIFQEKVKNAMVLFIVMLLSFASCVSLYLYQNFAKDTTNLLKLVGLELGTAAITGDNLEQIGEEIEQWDMVEQVLYSNTADIELTNGTEKMNISCDIWNDPEKLMNEIVIEGRLPKYENEIVISTKAANILKVEAGDIIYVKGNGEKKDYLVSGIDQKINSLGLKTLMTMDGFARLNGESKALSLYVYGKEGYLFSDLQPKLKKEFSGISATDSQKMTEDSLTANSSGITLICGIFVTITIFVVAMVVMLLIKTKLMREKKNYGISKALGFTTKQLMVQAMVSNLVVIFFGTVAGAILAKYFTNPLVSLFLSLSGIQKANLITGPFWILVAVVGIMIVAVGISLVFTSKIRKIEPVKMLQEEG